MHKLQVVNVAAGYGSKEVLHNVSFEITEPSLYVVLGPNGAGKTTLFRTLAGILEPWTGEIRLNGQRIQENKEARKSINYLSHYNALPEEMTVAGALEFYRGIEGGHVEAVLKTLNLEELVHHKVSELSQGQRKRVSIAKVFLRERDLYLLDEPTTALDPKMARDIRELLLSLSKNKVVLYSSHNLYEAREVGTYLLLIKNGSLRFFDRISNLKPGRYRVGIKALSDVSKVLDSGVVEGEYYVIEVDSPEAAGKLLKDLVERGVTVTEMRELDNPLESLFQE